MSSPRCLLFLYSATGNKTDFCSQGVNEMKNKQNTAMSPNQMVITDSPFAQALFGGVNWAWLWLIVRLYVGWAWLQAGWEKVTSPTWVGNKAGTALTGFINNALAKTSGAHPDVQSWYATFLHGVVLPHVITWSYLVAFGETLVGIGLILGAFTGIAAFFGILMNLNYLMAGSVSTNPILLTLSVFLVLAWKTAGWWGLDRWLLPALGTPWRPGRIFQGKKHGDALTPSTQH
jgi:thiosulfate dehydrogenase (quinone) large subunit